MYRSQPSAILIGAPSRLRLSLLGIGPETVSFERRGFALAPRPRSRLEEVGRTFVHGYRSALEDDDPAVLQDTFTRIDDELRGFAYEGAAMAVTLRDMLAPWRAPRFERLLAGPGCAHVYMCHVGAGWALARMRRGPQAVRRFDRLLRWLALDGYGFHEGFFRPMRCVRDGARPRGFGGYAARAFDQGLGRSLWFVEAAQPAPIAEAIGRFDAARHPDLWSGVALAAAYAGAAGAEALRDLAAAGAGCAGHLAQGAAFAAAARARAGNPAAHTELASRILCGVSAGTAAELTELAALSLPPDGAEPAYEVWRRRVRVAIAAMTPPDLSTSGRLA